MALLEPCGTLYTRYREDMRLVRTRWQWTLLVLFLLALVAFPFFASGALLVFSITMMVAVIAVVGLAILLGYGGEVSLGQAAFVMAGGYAAAIFDRAGVPFWLSLPASGIVAAALGLVFGAPSLRIKGFYAALATAAAQFMLVWVINHGGSFTRGPDGMPLRRPELAGLTFKSNQDFYFLTLAITVILVIFAYNLARSKAGRSLLAMRDNDIAAQAMGINLFAYKLLAFGVCSFYAGIAGALSAHFMRFISPESFSFADSIWYIGMVIVGGFGSVTGAIFGVTLFRVVGEILANLGGPLTKLFPQAGLELVSNLSLIVYGLIIAGFLILQPLGLIYLWSIFKTSYRLWPFRST